MELRAVKKLNVEREKVDGTAPSVEDLLAAADAEPAKPAYVSAGDYANAIHQLRLKGYTWQEVTDWMGKHGAEFSMQAIIAGYNKYYRPQTMPLSPGQLARDPANWQPRE